MPSGAKKRKAAKKKLQKEANNNNKSTNFDGSHSLGNDNDNDKSHDERESDVGEVERESSEEPVLGSHANDKEVSLTHQNVDTEESETKNGKHKRSTSSSSSSSSENDEVVVEKENPVIAEVAYSSIEESIPVEELVKNVVSLPQDSNIEKESESYENNPVVSSVVESDLKENLDEIVSSANEKDKISSGVTGFVDNVETKVIQVVYEDSEKVSGFVDKIPKDVEGLFPQSSGLTSTESCGDNHVKESETRKYVEEKPLISSAPLPVRRTSWTNCCGLFEVFSGGSSR